MTLLYSSCSSETGYLALASGNRVIIAQESSECADGAVQLNHLPSNNSPVVCLSCSSSGRLLAICTDNKTLQIWNYAENGWTLKSECTLPKRATVLAFTSDDQFILVADKAGDVTRYHVTSLSAPGSLLLGHLSMILDMVLALPSNSHVITCDRDEKIRVSRYPNAYNIETYCLGHSQFVSRLCVCKEWPHLLISASGDGSVRSWDWERGRLLDTAVCSREGDGGATPEAVTDFCCTQHTSPPLVVAALERSLHLVVFTLSSDGKLTECPEAIVKLATPPLSMVFDWSDRLWVCQLHQPEPLLCYHRHDNKLLKSENPLLTTLNKWEYFKDLSPRDWEILRKHDFDNMTSYFARKSERIKEQEDKKETAAKTIPSTTTAPIISSINELSMDNVGQTTASETDFGNGGGVSKQLDDPPEAKRMKTTTDL